MYCDRLTQSWSTATTELIDPAAMVKLSSEPHPKFTQVLHHSPPRINIHMPSSPAAAAAASATFQIEARDLCYRVPNRHYGPLHGCIPSCIKAQQDIAAASSSNILSHVCCIARPGEVLAVVGPSGAGKSTLLELLAGRLRPSSPPSSILVNSKPMAVTTFRRISGFISQHDALSPLLTVEETLMFSASLRLPSSVSQSDKLGRVASLIKELRLSHVADMRIGDDHKRGLSGGERRRVSIGVDVIHDPCVLFLDEPTSGLDSAAAFNVMEMLHAMASTRKRTIVLSIHQPSYKIIQQIDNFLLLHNGHVVHHGSLELLKCQLVATGRKIPAQVNMLEYTIDALISDPDFLANKTAMHIVKGKMHDNLNENDCNHPYTVHDKICSINKYAGNPPNLVPTYNNNPAREVTILAHRFALNVFRAHDLFTARLAQAIVGGVGLGSLYIHAGFSESGIEKRLGFFAFTLTYLLSTTVEALPIFLKERHVLLPETSRGAYRVSSYVMANVLVFIPFLLLIAVVFSGPVYWMIGLSGSAPAFAFFVMVVWMVLMMANSFVAFLSVLVPDYIVGNSIISACQGAFFLFSGYFIAERDMPKPWRFMHYVSLFKYPLEALLINEYTALKGKCFGPVSPIDHRCAVTGEDVLQGLGLQNASKWTDVGVMVAFMMGYRLLCYAVLRYKVCKRRR